MDSKSVRKVSESSVIGKGDSRYWQQAGKLIKDPRSRHLCCKIQVKGRRESFPLRTSSKAAAASKAAEIYREVLAFGWEATLAKHKPDMHKAPKPSTVGELLEAVKTTAGFRAITFTNYAQSIRQIVAGIQDITDQPALNENGTFRKDRDGRIVYLCRTDSVSGGAEAWQAAVHAQPLSVLTPEAIQSWRIAYIAKAGDEPNAVRSARNSANSKIRNARALFSEKALQFVKDKLVLPEPLPFAGVKLEKRQSTRYISRIDASTLIAKAKTELDGDPFKIFCFGLICGLRKREIDTLLWRQIDFDRGTIQIEATEYFHPKSEESIGAVDLDEQFVRILRGWRAQATGDFVIESHINPRHDKTCATYRSGHHFKTLYAWLRKQGISSRKPLHELRKECGAILASNLGIFAAQRVLRHAQIATTASYYADKKQRITTGLGSILESGTTESKLVPFETPATADKLTREAQ